MYCVNNNKSKTNITIIGKTSFLISHIHKKHSHTHWLKNNIPRPRRYVKCCLGQTCKTRDYQKKKKKQKQIQLLSKNLKSINK